jgi:hypothetical protein
MRTVDRIIRSPNALLIQAGDRSNPVPRVSKHAILQCKKVNPVSTTFYELIDSYYPPHPTHGN